MNEWNEKSLQQAPGTWPVYCGLQTPIDISAFRWTYAAVHPQHPPHRFIIIIEHCHSDNGTKVAKSSAIAYKDRRSPDEGGFIASNQGFYMRLKMDRLVGMRYLHLHRANSPSSVLQQVKVTINKFSSVYRNLDSQISISGCVHTRCVERRPPCGVTDGPLQSGCGAARGSRKSGRGGKLV